MYYSFSSHAICSIHFIHYVISFRFIHSILLILPFYTFSSVQSVLESQSSFWSINSKSLLEGGKIVFLESYRLDFIPVLILLISPLPGLSPL